MEIEGETGCANMDYVPDVGICTGRCVEDRCPQAQCLPTRLYRGMGYVSFVFECDSKNIQLFLYGEVLYCKLYILSFVGSLRDREVACSASYLQGLNFESCVWTAVSSHSSYYLQEVFLAKFSLYVHNSGLKPDSFHL